MVTSDNCPFVADGVDGVFDAETAKTLMQAAAHFDAYQEEALRSAGDEASGTGGLPPVVYLSMGICGEAGELIDHIKKRIRDNQPIDVDDVVEELGDLLWYIAVLTRRLTGGSLSDVAYGNIVKLRERYPDGFSAERSINRLKREQHKAYK